MEKAGALLHALFERLSIQDERGFVRFFSSWRKIAGNDLADHSKLVDVRHNAAVVVVDHPGWMQLLRMQQERILKFIQQEFPDLDIHTMHIHLIDERVGEAPKTELVSETSVQSHAEPATDTHTLTPPDNPDQAIQQVQDDDLKRRLEALKKAMESSGP